MFEFLGDIISKVPEYLTNIVDFFKNAFEFLYLLFTFIPEPFRTITFVYLGIISIILIVKLVRGS